LMATATGRRVKIAIIVTAKAARAAEIVLKPPVSFAESPPLCGIPDTPKPETLALATSSSGGARAKTRP